MSPGENKETAGCQVPPLVIDLDGTLSPADSLWEGLLLLLRERPACLFLLPVWLWRGRLPLKYKSLPYSLEQADFMPVRPEILALIGNARGSGRRVYLATAAPAPLAEKISSRYAFDGFFASTAELNLKGEAKAAALRRAFGEKGFDYIGDSKADLPAWLIARKALSVSPSLMASIRRVNPDCSLLPVRKTSPRDYLGCLRPHQWIKNLLIVIPLLAAHLFSWEAMLSVLAAIAGFNCCASAGYMVNDLLDLRADRSHPVKKRRPFASGAVSIFAAPWIMLALLAGVLLVCLVLPPGFAVWLVLYVCLSFAYSLYLKGLLMLDVCGLTCLYLLRVAAGGAVLDLRLSNWLLAFCLFVFLSLALLKRVGEIKVRSYVTGGGSLPNRAYVRMDKRILEMMSVGAYFSAAVVLMFYIDSMAATALYSRPDLLYVLLMIYLFWNGRMLLLASRKEWGDDPVRFVIQDKSFWVSGLLGLVVFLGAIRL